jgi:hypothetical protein
MHLTWVIEVSVSNIDTDSDFASFLLTLEENCGKFPLYHPTIRRYAHMQTETLMTSLTKPQQQDNWIMNNFIAYHKK